MMTEVMITKLSPPRIGGELIERPRLLEAFAHCRDLKLIVVTAPAGYGKTVATLQYINSLRSPFVWYQLDVYDNDPAVFIQYLIAGFRKHFPGFGTAVLQRALRGNIASSLRFMVVSIVNELAGLPDRNFVLVLDDYHQITAPVIHHFMEQLLEHLPTGIRVVIVSRTPPAIPFSRFQVRDELATIDLDALRFNASEAREFLAKRRVDASESQLESLISRTDGWAAALKLLTGAAGKDLDTPEGASGWAPARETKYIYDYLANEVFDRQPEETRDFMVAVAVLETMTPEMCDALLDRNDSQEVLESLDREQLFLIPLAGLEKAYRYHQLFRDFLLERLGPRRNDLWRKAGEIVLHNGNLDQAMNYYLAEIDQDSLLLFQKAGKEAFRQGRWQTVERWLELVSPDHIAADQWLCFFQAQIKIYQGKLDEAESWIHKSLALFAAREDAVGIAECRFLQARIFNIHGRHRESLNLLTKAYPILQESTPFLRFDLPLEMGITLFRNGRFQEAEELLTRSLEVAERQNDFWIMAHLLEGLGNIYYWTGELAKALQCYKKGIRISPNHMLPSYNFQDFIASIYHEWGELDQAFEYAQRSVTVKENLGMSEALPTAYYQLGSIYTDRGEFIKAEACYRKGIDLAENGGGLHFLSLNKAYLAQCLCFQDRLVESLDYAEQVLTLAQTQSETLQATCRVLCAPTFIRSGDIAKAKEMLLEALPPIEQWRFAKPLCYGYANLAVIDFKTGNLRQAGELSRKLLELAASKNLIQLFLTMSEFQVILRYGMENAIEVSFIQRVLVRLRERGVNLLKELTHHPDPAVRVRTILPLSQINTPATQELFKFLSKDSNPEVRRSAKRYANLSGNSAVGIGENPDPEIPVTQKEFTREQPVNRVTPEQDSAPRPLLKIHVLGPARIFLNNSDITTTNWRFIKSRDLLLYLCHQGQPVPVNQILEDLWPELSPDKSIKSFYSVLYWLRQAIQKDAATELVVYAAKTCHLLSSVYTTDRDRFISLINAGSADINRNKNALEEAIALYQGDYLSQLDYPWVIPEQEHLKRLFLETVIRLAKFYLQNGEHHKTIAVLESIAAQNPLREEIFGLLMSAYAALGDRLAVIRQYQKLKANLLEELGLEPVPEITKLYYELCGSKGNNRQRLKKA